MRLKQLVNPFVRSQVACEQVFAGAPIVRVPQATHTLICAPSGSGKDVALITPHALTCERSMVFIDPKGETAKLTARAREKLGQRVVLLDPYRVVTETPDTFNPLEFIDADSREAIDDCNDLGAALVVRSGHEPDPHWSDSAEAYLSAIIAAVVAYG